MKDNKDILKEASFFRKNTTYAERQKSKLPQYQPADVKNPGKTPIAVDAYQVTSTAEVKKRLAGTFGATFGNNNVKSMASRAIKTFPIIISDNIEPETAITLKRLMEDQYAEYINLLISNQVVNLADYRAGDANGNIAIQALDTISGADFSSSRVADNANNTGTLKGDDIFANIPLYNLLRENSMVISTGDSLTDAILENACIVPSENAKALINFIENYSYDIVQLSEAPYYMPATAYADPSINNIALNQKAETARNVKLSSYMSDLAGDADSFDITGDVKQREINRDALRGYQGLDADGKEIYTKLSTADIVIDKKQMDRAINRSVGEILCRPENVEIRDKFEKATMLLQSCRISGMEFYQYCVLRLGIPVSNDARIKLATDFPVASIIAGRGISGSTGGVDNLVTIDKNEIDAISRNRKVIEKDLKLITDIPLWDAMQAVAGAGAGSVIGGLSAGAVGATLSAKGLLAATPMTWFFAGPLMLSVLAGSAVGMGAVVLSRWLRKRRIQRMNAKAQAEYDKLKANPNIEGWERVEALINQWDAQQDAIRNLANSATSQRPYVGRTKALVSSNDNQESIDELNKAEEQIRNAKDYLTNMEIAQRNFNRVLTESTNITFNESRQFRHKFTFIESEKIYNEIQEDLIECAKYFSDDKELLAELKEQEILMEKKKPIAVEEPKEEKEYGDAYLTTQTIMDINDILKGNARSNVAVRYIDKPEDKDVLITPQFMATDNFAYGTTEIERKENKDRKYNQPLIMTVKFRGRFQDDKFSDNELTAVIGILGKIIRVSSAEMEYILKENAEGNTVEGFFKNTKGDLANTISDLLATSKISKDLKNLPQSADIWHNLEKVATLAAANKITGKRNRNIANAHIVFSQKEIDDVRNDTGIDYLKDIKKSVALMKRYSAFTLMVANDPGQRLYMLDDQDAISWNAVPYSAIVGKDSGDQLNAFLNKMTRLN